MNIMRRFTLRSLKLNRKWTVVTIIGIILSTAMITAVSAFTASFTDLMRNEVIAGEGNWHAAISDVRMRDVPTLAEASPVDEVMLSRDLGYARLEGVKDSNRPYLKPYLFIKQYDKNSAKNFPVTLVAGRMPQNDGELVISQHIATNEGVTYRIGDTLTLAVGQRRSPDGLTLGQDDPYPNPATSAANENEGEEQFAPEFTATYTVVGMIDRPSFEPGMAPGYSAFTYLDAQTFKPDDTVDVTLLATRVGRHFFDDMTALAQSVGLDDGSVTFHNTLLRYYGVVRNDTAQNMLYGFAAVIMVIIMIASVSLIYNAFAISVSERTRQLGMLASVGATKRQKRHHVYWEGFLLGLVGIPLGILAGLAGIGITIRSIGPLMESFMTFASSGLHLVVSPLSIAAAAVLAALTIFISVWFPARRASRIMPIDAVRQSRDIRLTARAVRTSPLTRALFGFAGEIALKNLKRNRKKYRATILSLVISLVLFLTVSNYAAIIAKTSVTDTQGYNSDIIVFFNDTPAAEIEAVSRQIAALDLVTEAAMVETASGVISLDATQLSATARHFYEPDAQGKYELTAQLYCPDGASFQKYARSIGLDPQEYQNPARPQAITVNYAQTIVNNKRTAGEIVTVRPGETLVFRPSASGDEPPAAGAGFELELGALTGQRPLGMLMQSFDRLSLVVSPEVFAAWRSGLPAAEANGERSLFLNSSDSDRLQEQIYELTLGLSGSQPPNIINLAAEIKAEHDWMLVLGVFVYGFIILISLICIANIFNTISTNVALRRREFAMLRSVGMTPGSFNKMIRFESIFYGLTALLYGLPLSIAVSVLLYRLQASSFEVGFVFPWASYGAAIALILAIVTLTMLYASAKIKKENIIDALKEENM